MKKLHYLLLILTLALAGPSAMARTGGQFQVNGTGTTWAGVVPTSTLPQVGDTISTSGSYGVFVRNSGSFSGADGWIIEMVAHTSSAIYVTGASFFSGSNLSVSTDSIDGNQLAHGVHADGANSNIELVSSTISTLGEFGIGLFAQNGGTISGSNLSVSTERGTSRGVWASDANSNIELVSSTISTSGSTAHGLLALSGGTISGSNLSISTEGNGSGGAYSSSANANIELVSSTISTSGSGAYGLLALTGATLTGSNLCVSTEGANAHGITVGRGSAVTVTDSDFTLNHATAALVAAYGTGNNSATLTRATANLASGIVYSGSDSATNTLNINESTLNGDLQAANTGQSTIALTSSTLTGMSTQLDDSRLMMNISASSQWNVTAASTLSSLDIQGTLGVTLVGDSLTSALMTLTDTATLDGQILLNFTGFSYKEDFEYSYTLFNSGALDGDYLANINWGNLTLGDGWWLIDQSFTDGVLKFSLTTVDPIPEPGTWALMLGGLGVLGYLQRARRKTVKA